MVDIASLVLAGEAHQDGDNPRHRGRDRDVNTNAGNGATGSSTVKTAGSAEAARRGACLRPTAASQRAADDAAVSAV
jgi:hypothetical protein